MLLEPEHRNPAGTGGDFAELVEVLRPHHLVAADVVELAHNWMEVVSSVLAAKVTRSLLLLLGRDQ